MTTIPIKTNLLFLGLAVGVVSGDFGVASIFSLKLCALVCFWYKGCFRHLHTDNQDNARGCNRLNMGVNNDCLKSRRDDDLNERLSSGLQELARSDSGENRQYS